MRSSEKGEIVRRVMRVILDSRMEGKRRERQGDVAFVVDRIDTFRFRVGSMPIRTRIKIAVGSIGGNLHNEIRILIRARGDSEHNFFVDLLCPSLRSIELYAV